LHSVLILDVDVSVHAAALLMTSSWWVRCVCVCVQRTVARCFTRLMLRGS